MLGLQEKLITFNGVVFVKTFCDRLGHCQFIHIHQMAPLCDLKDDLTF